MQHIRKFKIDTLKSSASRLSYAKLKKLNKIIVWHAELLPM